MDDEDLLVQQLVKSLAFEVEAVAAENIVKFSTTGTPLNVKVRVRNKDEPRLVQRGLVSVPRIGNQLTAPEKIRLISSDQTILSFNVYMETDLEKETQTPKSRKHGFNFLKFGGCLGTSVGDDDDEGAYETSNKSQSGIIIDEIEGSQEKVKLNMENSKIVTRNQKGFFGKCKPGGCLDPPFSEDKYPYGLPKTQQQPTPNLALNKAEESKDNRSKSIPSVEPRKLSKLTDEPIKKGQRPSRSEVESKPLVDIFARISSSQNSLGSNHSNIITYPPRLSSSEMIRDNQDTRKRNKSKTFNESPRQSNENPVAYFVPPKDTLRQKEEERRYSRELSSDQIRINDDSVKDATSRNNGNRKRTLRNHSFETSSINNAKFTEMKPIAFNASQGREDNYPKRVKQTSTDLTLNNNDNVPKIPLQGKKKSDIVLLTPHVDQIDNIKNPKFSEVKPIAVSASQGREENYPKRIDQTSTDATLNYKDNVRITPLQGREQNDILLLTPHVDQIENIKNAKFAEIKPIAVSASQGSEENYPKKVEQTSTDATLNYKDNVRISPLQGRETKDILLLTPHVDQIENVKNAKFAEIKPIAVSASQGKEENYPKRVEQTSTDGTLNYKDNVRITPLQGREKNDILLLTPHVDQIENVNNAKFAEYKPIAVSASQGREENQTNSIKKTLPDVPLNDKDNVRIQENKKSDILLPTPHMDQIKHLNDRSNIQSVPVTGPNNLDDFDKKDDLSFQTKSQFHNEGTLDYGGISSDNMFKKLGNKKDIIYDSKDETKKDKIMPLALESEKDQKLEQNEQSQNKKTKLTLKTKPNFSSSLQNLLDASELKGINKVVSDTSSQNTQSKSKKDTNTYPSTSADADKIQSFSNKSEATKSQTEKEMDENQNKDIMLLSNATEVSESIDPKQTKKQDFPSNVEDPINSRSYAKKIQEALQDIRVKETSKKVDTTHKSDTINKLIEDPDIFNKQTYGTPASNYLKTEISNGTVQDQNTQLNNLDTRAFKNKITDDKHKEQDNERTANIYGSREDNLNNADRYIDSLKSNAHPDKQNNLKMPIYSSQTKNGHNNINDVGISESHVLKPFMIKNGEQGIDDHMSQTQPITDTSTEKRQANKKLQKTASHDSTVSENKEFARYSAHSLDLHKKITSTYDDTKKPVNIQHNKDKSSGREIAKPSSVDHVIIQNDLVFDHNEIPHTEAREKRSSLVKMPFAATGSNLHSDEASKMIPLKHKAFPIVESNKSVEKQIEEISTLQNLTHGGSETENDDKSVPRGQAQERVLDGREIQLVGSDSALNLTNLDKQAKKLLLDSDKTATEIIGVSRKSNKTNVDDADGTYFQPKLSITETERGKIIQNQLTSGLHQDYAPISLGLPSDDTNQIDNIGFKNPEPLTPSLNIDNTTHNISHNSIGMDREGDSETKKQNLMENMEKPPTSASDQYFKELLKDRNAKLATKPSNFNDMNVSQSNVNQLADQLSSIITTDEINKEVKTLPINYTLEDGTSMFNPTMEKTNIGSEKISSATTRQETSGSSIIANSARQDNPQLSTTAVGKMDSEFNAANQNYADTETFNFKHDTKTYDDDMTKITSGPLKSTVGDYNLEKTMPQFDEFTDDTIIKSLGLGVKKDTNNKNIQKQKDIANFMKQSDSKMGRGSKKSIDETRRKLLNVTKTSNNKSTPLSKFLDTDSMNKTNLESLDISAIPTEKDKFELLLNMKFQTYVNENNDIVVQTLNPRTEEQNLESDKVIVVNSLIRPGNEINIHVDSEHNLTLGLYDNYHMSGYQNNDELKAYQHVSPDATENEIVLHKNLTLLYETELVPLHNAIMSLTEEINALSVNQELLKAKLQGAKRNRSTRISPVNRHCGCRRS